MITRKEVEQDVYTQLRARYLANLITNEVMLETIKLKESGLTAEQARQEKNHIESQNILLEAQIKLVESKIDEGNKEDKPAEKLGKESKSN